MCRHFLHPLAPDMRQEWLLQLLRGRNGSKDRLDELDLRVRGAYGPLAEEPVGSMLATVWRDGSKHDSGSGTTLAAPG